MEPKTYTEEEVQQLINRQRFITTYENVIDRFAPQMSKYELDTCEAILKMLAGTPTPSPVQAQEGAPMPAGANGGGDDDKYPD